ncbi:MAG: ABC transporter permease [Candidatus Binatia bacterium]|nr:ABC transporter permease [Candidatus Binatia bacterium]
MLSYELRNLLRARWLYGYAGLFFGIASLTLSFSEGGDRALLALAHASILVIPLVSAVAAANSTYVRKPYDAFLLTQPVSRAVVFSAAVGALVITFAGSFFIPGAAVVLPAGLPLVPTSRMLLASVALSTNCVLAGVLVATWIEERTRGLGVLLLAWLIAALVYDGALLYVIVAFEEYPIEPLLTAAVLFNPIDAVRLVLYQDLGLRFLLPVVLPSGAVWLSLALWGVVLLGLGLRAFLKKDY